MRQFHEVLMKRDKTSEDKALVAAVMLLSTQHDPDSEKRSFSHLTMEEVFDKLVSEYEETMELSA